MPATDQGGNQPKSYEELSQNHDPNLNGIIKEIDELRNKNKKDDKIESDVIVNEQLNSSLKSYFEGHKDEAIIILNKINTIDTRNLAEDVIKSLQNLAKLISEIINKPSEQNEAEKNKASFEKFKTIIEEKRLKDLNSLKHEVEGIKSFVSDTNNFITTLNLYAEMTSLTVGDAKRFLSTDKEVYNSVFNKIEEKYNINKDLPNHEKYDLARRTQLGTILQPAKASKDSLKEIAKTYLGIENWDGKDIETKNDGKFADGIELISTYNQFVSTFNIINQKINQKITPQEPPQSNTPETGGNDGEQNEGNNNGGFDKTAETKGTRMDQERVNEINSTAGEYAFLKLEGENLSYNLNNVKSFLTTIAKAGINDFRTYYKKPGDPKRTAWLTATQILLNENIQNKKIVVDGEYRGGGETRNLTKEYQKHYNEGHQDKLRVDGIPGPQTLSALLGIRESTQGGNEGREGGREGGNEGGNEGLDEKDFYDYEKEIINTDSEKFYEGYEYKAEEKEAHHHYKRGRIIENIKSLVDKIQENENINHQKIIEEIRGDLVTLPRKEKISIIKGVHTVVKKFETIRKNIDDIKQNPKKRLCDMRMFNTKDTTKINPGEIKGKITAKQIGIEIAFFVEDDADFYYIRNGDKWDGSKKITSGGFNCQTCRNHEFDGTLTVIRGAEIPLKGGMSLDEQKKFATQQITTMHEGQHNWNTYFMNEKVEKVDKINTPIVSAKDEIIAYLRGGLINNETKLPDIDRIEKVLTGDDSIYKYNLSGQSRENHKTKVKELLVYVRGLMDFVKKGIIKKGKIISMLSDTHHTERKKLYDNIKKSVDNGTVGTDYWRAGTETQEAEINNINLANSIKEVKHILCDPKYSHIGWVPNSKGGIEVSLIIDKIMEKANKNPLDNNEEVGFKFISPDIRQKVGALIIKESPNDNRDKLKGELINSFPEQEKEEARRNIESQLS